MKVSKGRSQPDIAADIRLLFCFTWFWVDQFNTTASSLLTRRAPISEMMHVRNMALSEVAECHFVGRQALTSWSPQWPNADLCFGAFCLDVRT